MTTLKTLLAAVAATALTAGAAHAQMGQAAAQDDPANQAAPADPRGSQTAVPSVDSTRPTGADAGKTSMPSGEVNPAASGDTMAAAPTDTTTTTTAAAASTGTATNTAAVTTTTTANQPVADTPENRAKYKPLSRAGRATSAKGN